MKQLFAFLLLCVCASAAFGQGDVRTRGSGGDQPAAPQSRRITGRVLDASGQPVIGATVSVVDRASGRTVTGTYSDANGNYSVDADVSQNIYLRVSYVGYDTQEISLNANSSTVNITLQEGAGSVLEEQVVTAYGTATRKDLTSSVATLKGEAISNLPVQSFDQALSGRLAGVYVNQQNGLPNNTSAIRVRGTGSISQSSSPLIVVDGTPINQGDQTFLGGNTRNNALGDIPANDIESYQVLKDAAATAPYGSRGANGVILITTKRGKQGRPTVTYDAWVGWTEAFRLPQFFNTSQFVAIKEEARINAGGTTVWGARNPDNSPLLDPATGQPYDINWTDLLYRTGFQHNHTIQVRGGTDRLSYLVSLNYSDQNGYILASRFRRNQARVNFSYKVVDWFTVGTNINVSGTNNSGPPVGSDNNAFAANNIARQVWILYPNTPAKLPDGQYNNLSNGLMNTFGQPGYGLGGGQGNPLIEVELNRRSNEALRLIGQVYAEAQIPGVKGLSVRSQYGIDYLWNEDFSSLVGIGGTGFASGGQTFNVYTTPRIWNWNTVITYATTIAEDHRINVRLGHEAQRNWVNQFFAQRLRQADPAFVFPGGVFTDPPQAGGAFSDRGLVSIFGLFSYTFRDKYIVSANVRRDGLSNFQPSKRWGDFFSFSGAWVLSEESFFKNFEALSFVDYLKFRGSWGKLGNSELGNDFAAFNFYGGALYGTVPGLFYGGFTDPNLQWETSEQFDLGVDINLFKERIRIEFDWYNRLSNNLILFNPQAPSKGFGGIDQNLGVIRNWGTDLTIAADVLKTSWGFDWTTTLVYSTNQNELLRLGLNNNDIIFSASGGLESITINRVGQPISSFFTTPWVGVNPANGLSMFLNAAGQVVQYHHGPSGVGTDGIARTNGFTLVETGAPTANPSGYRTLNGQPTPRWQGGWDNTFKYKGIELTVLVRYSGGNQIYAGSRAQWQDARALNNHVMVLNRWTTPGQQTDIPRVVLGDNISNGSGFAISKHVQDADFLRIQNIILAYELPTSIVSKLKLQNIKVNVQVQNAFLFTNYDGVDPEANLGGDVNNIRGLDRNVLPQARTYSMGILIGF